ncbi:hypothetical protein J7E97_25160 [Streptomyces sp. ISL-66]|uniref:hypothetical protein n=1 Tax=Streptomyces sp. ISL-66 TaxID=2819186 RepID=UPI001BE7B8C1|nr:hypothetical protein [Streptomyces sp. ISL-66]MBT2471062.1 hypothetical protein [Streptomyces sp. ISL-66]
MADERDRWLDKAAADRLLRGEPAPPGAEQRARAQAERLRAALDALAEPSLSGAGELPGEAAALAAFRAARGTAPREGAPAAEEFGSGETVVDLSPLRGIGAGGPSPERGRIRSRNQGRNQGQGHGQDHGAGPRRGRPVRFVLAAAVASVAVGGLAAAAGAGLLDGDTRDGAAHAPAVSVTTGSSSGASGGDDPMLIPQPRLATPRGGESRGTATDPGNTPGAEGGTPAGSGGDGASGTGGGATTGPSANGSTPDRGGEDRFLEGGTDGSGDGVFNDREGRTRAVELCRDFQAGKLDSERREKLVRLAKGLLSIPRYCKSVLDGTTTGADGRSGSTSASGAEGPVKAPSPTPAKPDGGEQGADGSLGLRSRP